MPNGANSACIDPAIASSACLVAAYGPPNGIEIRPPIELVNTIFPGRPSSMNLRTNLCVSSSWGEEIALEHTPEQLHRDFGDGAAFSDCRIVDQRINVPVQCVLDVVGMHSTRRFFKPSVS